MVLMIELPIAQDDSGDLLAAGRLRLSVGFPGDHDETIRPALSDDVS